ncbi:putative diguanylate cyclase [Gordonia polyisoprenivorans VH2]|uniref:Putative diguanylate cyclase n=1 Tax=Gordonia polyisoprenivorans (strain DSM 44266 / VH2) TaxID=1112204 RepID=H6N2A3_GORPV|nr:GGDEF domain-containing protein [Gordonia polyisoprenivorans]AFA72216.1 putative diguanylate cyclase [Gordonia polyisoprenivorans VH2]
MRLQPSNDPTSGFHPTQLVPATKGVDGPSFARSFDQRTIGVLVSETGAIPLILLGLLSSTFLKPNCQWVLVVIGVYTLLSVAVTVYARRLSDRGFALLSFGGMLGVAGSALVIADNGAALAVLVLLAAIPALSAMDSSLPVVLGFVLTAAILVCVVVSIRATSTTALIVGGGAALMAIAVPTYLVTSLRRRLTALLHQQAQLSVTDPLTLALNRRGLLDGAIHLFRTAAAADKHVAFLVVDVDYFKKYNDTHGHSAGDAVLVEITNAIQNAVPPSSLVARSGGEEFAILTATDDAAGLSRLADDIRLTVASTTDATVSVGGVCAKIIEATYDSGHPTLSELMDRLSAQADQLLYAAKGMGRNRAETASVAPSYWRHLHSSPSDAQDDRH